MNDNRPFAQPLSNELFIGGAWRRTGSGGTMDHIDPATGCVNGTVTLGGKTEIDEAVAAACQAQRVWMDMGAIARRQCLSRLADIVEARVDDFRALAAAEMGMPRRGFEERHRFAVEWIRTYQGWADKIGGDITATEDSGRFEFTRLEPYGVIGIILTWNSPLLSLTMKIPAALAAGNAVVVKPSELTPYTAMLFARACVEAGIPDGVVNIVPGGIEAGEALVIHPDVEKISFTGGGRAATAMMKAGAHLIKPFCFELGGKSAHLVFADADPEKAADVACAGLANAGQSCTFGSRLYVHTDLYDAFRDAMRARLAKLPVGDPASEETRVGPLVSAAARDRVLELVRGAVDNNEARLLCGGTVPEMAGALAGGYFVTPALFEDVLPDSRLLTEEIFGPVFALNSFDDEDQVIDAVNNTDFGLSNYVHTDDLRRALRVTSRLRSGTVYVNDASRRNAGAPFGGYKRSGIGYEGGRPGLDEYLRRKTVGLA